MKDKTNLVHIIFSLHTGGSETMLVDILNEQCKRCPSHLIIINNEITQEIITTLDPAVNIHYINRQPGSVNPLPLVRLNLLLRKIRPTTVHMHNVATVRILIPVLSSRYQKVLTIHDLGISCRGLARYDRLFAISKAVQNDILERCNVKSTVMNNGIKFSNVKRKEAPALLHQPLRIVQVSRLAHEKKGQHLLIEALALLRQQYGIAVEVTFIGEGSSEKHLVTLARKLGVEKYCNFPGRWSRQQVYKKLYKYDILVQPSLYEGFGLTVVEGIAAGLPVIASDSGGPAEILDNGRYGWVFKIGESSSLAEVISKLVEKKYTEELVAKTNKAYEHVKALYEIRNTANGYLEAYESKQ